MGPDGAIITDNCDRLTPRPTREDRIVLSARLFRTRPDVARRKRAGAIRQQDVYGKRRSLEGAAENRSISLGEKFRKRCLARIFRRALASKAISKTIVKLRRVESQTNGASGDNGEIGGFMAYRLYVLILFATAYPSMR